MKNFKWYII
jgi:hypothetical protein